MDGFRPGAFEPPAGGGPGERCIPLLYYVCIGGSMRTTLNLPRELLAEAQRAAGARTKTQAIILGLQELTRRKKIERLWDLRGRLDLDLDLKDSRRR